MTVYEDNSIVFWDIASGSILEARNVFDVHIHQPGTPLPIPEIFHPIETVRWVCGEDPENTKLLISGVIQMQLTASMFWTLVTL